jgi:hypothetical protein
VLNNEVLCIQYLNLALAADPHYALGHAALSLVYSTLAEADTVPANELLLQAKAQGMDAKRLDSSLAESHHALARILLLSDYDWHGADHEFRRPYPLIPPIPMRVIATHICASIRGAFAIKPPNSYRRA